MRYIEDRFTLPTVNTQIDTVTYEVRVGLRCPVCHERYTDQNVFDSQFGAGRHECQKSS